MQSVHVLSQKHPLEVPLMTSLGGDIHDEKTSVVSTQFRQHEPK